MPQRARATLHRVFVMAHALGLSFARNGTGGTVTADWEAFGEAFSPYFADGAGRLGGGLAHCDPNGTGKIVAFVATELVRTLR